MGKSNEIGEGLAYIHDADLAVGFTVKTEIQDLYFGIYNWRL